MSGDLPKLIGLRVNAEKLEDPGLPAQCSLLLQALAPVTSSTPAVQHNVEYALNPVSLINAFFLQKKI